VSEWVCCVCVCVCVCVRARACVCVCVCVCVCIRTLYAIQHNKKKTGAVPLWHLWVQPTKKIQKYKKKNRCSATMTPMGTTWWRSCGVPSDGNSKKSQKKNSQKSPPCSDVVIQWICLVWFLRIFLWCHFWLLRYSLICDVVQLMCLVWLLRGKNTTPHTRSLFPPGATACSLLQPTRVPYEDFIFYFFPSWRNCLLLVAAHSCAVRGILVKSTLYSISYTFVK
jgi:hypothetical protein